jgi:hypothetical protein
VAGLLHSGALPIKDVSVFASSNIYDDHSDTGLLCRAEKLRDALVKAGVVSTGAGFLLPLAVIHCVVLCHSI